MKCGRAYIAHTDRYTDTQTDIQSVSVYRLVKPGESIAEHLKAAV